MQTGFSYRDEIISYYNTCWLERFQAGHNPKSLAMHMGYFEKNPGSNDEAKNAMNRYVAETLGFDQKQQNKVVIDAGCGVGGTCMYLAREYQGLKITGINISEQQIKLAEEFVSNQSDNLSDIKFLCEDYCETSVKANSVDIIYGIESVCHAEIKEAFFKEAFRILKPGGTLLIVDYVNTLKQNELADTTALLNAFQKGWTVKEYITMPKENLEKAGFAHVIIKSITPRVMPGIVNSYNGAIQKISALNGSISPIVKRHLEACIALKSLSEKGIIDYCIIKATKPA